MNEYFKREEFECKCGCGLYYPNELLLLVLTDLREHFDQPVFITSATRCPTHNAKVGGAKSSQHIKGTAADIQVYCVDPSLIQDYLEAKYPHTLGIGRYHNFTHVDVRSGKSRWGITY